MVELPDPDMPGDLYNHKDYIYYRGPYDVYRTRMGWSAYTARQTMSSSWPNLFGRAS